MPNAQYDRYLESIFEFCKTLVIKSDVNAQAINNHLKEIGYEISEDEREWKYYKNLAGEYHSADEMMYVVSTDTLEQIEFSKESFQTHRNTRYDYEFGSRFYYSLVEQYPDQESLILGILNPVNKEDAVKAKEGKILDYNPDLIEGAEYAFIDQLQSWIDSFLIRCSVDDYALSDEYYPAARWAVMFAHMPLEILNIRTRNAGSAQTHSFHIREHLASNQHLDQFMGELDLEQRLFLYRNINYIQRYPGRHETFQTLLDNLVTASRLPLSQYTVEHNYISILEDSDLLCNIDVYRHPLNNVRADDRADQRGVLNLLRAQSQLTPLNSETIENEEDAIVRKFKHSQFARLPTKVLESAIIDTSESKPILLDDTLINHWLYFSSMGMYTTNIQVTDPRDGSNITLDANSAFYVWLYASNHNPEHGYSATDIFPTLPGLYAHYVRQPVRPSRDQLKSVTHLDYVTDEQIEEIYQSIAPEVVARDIISVEDFKFFCEDLNTLQNQQRDFYQRQEDPITRAMLEAAVSKLYFTPFVEPPEQTGYPAFLNALELPVHEMTFNEADTLASNIVEEATGIGSPPNSALNRRQTNILGIMKRLTSYSIQYIQQINDDTFYQLESISTRVKPTSWTGRQSRYIELRRFKPLEYGFKGRLLLDMRKEGGLVAYDHISVEQTFDEVDLYSNYYFEFDREKGSSTRQNIPINPATFGFFDHLGVD